MAFNTIMLPSDVHLSSPLGILLSIFALITIVVLYNAIFNLYFSPLSHIPGPLLARASPLPYALRVRSGTSLSWMRKLHEQYGEVVRIAPNEVSFISGETAWQDIYGPRTGQNKTPPYLKDRLWYYPSPNGIYSILSADEANHSKMRKHLSHAFSDKALREQEPLYQGLIDLLVQRLYEQAKEKRDVDMMRWYNYTTFDIIADIIFGEPLYCLRDDAYHWWVDMVYGAGRSISFLAMRRSRFIAYYDQLKSLFQGSAASVKMRKTFFSNVSAKVTERISKDAVRPDLMEYIAGSQKNPEKAMSKDEIDTNAFMMMIAGSETTATMLSGFTWLLLKHPGPYTKLVREIRSRFTSQSDITLQAVNDMEYLMACLQEGLRFYPPVPLGFPRVVPVGGDRISGHYIPEGTSVSISQHATYHSSRNFKDPDLFVPERWLGDERYAHDKRDVLNPFSFGPRNCLGKNLAYAEMRLVIAKVLFNFDLELVDICQDWIGSQKVYTLWQKPPLMVRLHPIRN